MTPLLRTIEPRQHGQLYLGSSGPLFPAQIEATLTSCWDRGLRPQVEDVKVDLCNQYE